MNIEIKYEGLPDELILNLTFGSIKVEWEETQATPGYIYGKGVTFNGECANGRLREIYCTKLTELELYDGFSETVKDYVKITSISFYDTRPAVPRNIITDYEVSPRLLGRFTTVRVETENLVLDLTGEQYYELQDFFNEKRLVNNYIDIVNSNDALSDEEVENLTEDSVLNKMAHIFDDIICEYITGENEQEVIEVCLKML